MFSQTTEYALRAMSCLALYPDQLVPTNTLAEMTKVPNNYLAKVLQQLAAVNLIAGRRGVGGGYKLARPADQISILEIIQKIGVLRRIPACPLGLENHSGGLCALHRALDSAAEAVIRQLEGVSLKHLLSENGVPNKPLCDVHATQTLTVKGKLHVDRGRHEHAS